MLSTPPLRATTTAWIALALVAVLTSIAAWFSLSWRATLDAPYMMFLPFEAVHWGLKPYAELYDHNAPGGFVASTIAWALGGASDGRLRAIDLTWLLATLAASMVALRRLGPAAVAGPLLFALFYLDLGPLVAFQREYQLLLPVALAACATAYAGELAQQLSVRAFLAGLGIGVATAIKPVAALVLVLFAGWWWLEAPAARRRTLPMLGAGFATAGLTMVLLLWAVGGLWAYLDIVTHYYPLYNTITGDNVVVTGADRLTYDFQELRGYLSGKKRWLVFAATGLAAGWWGTRHDPANRRIVVLTGLAIPAGLLYAVLLGKFFDYHWLPVHAALALAAGYWLLAPRCIAAVALVLGAWLTHWPSPDVQPQWQGKPAIQDELVMVDRLVVSLQSRLRRDDTVQILEWTNGGAQAGLAAGVKSATSFYQDFMFYHHISTPYIQGLRARFLAEFDAAKPGLVVRVHGEERALFGSDTEARWNDLETRLERDYTLVEQQLGFALYERKDRLQ